MKKTKRFLLLVGVVIMVLYIALGSIGCPYFTNACKSCQSGTTGLNRIVTLYAADGSVIGTWEGRNMYVDTTDGVCSFIDGNGRRVILGGTFVIQEK